MLSSMLNIFIFNLAGKGRSHLLLRDKEEDKTVTGLKKIKERQSIEIKEAEEEISNLSQEILKLKQEVHQKNEELKENEKHRQLLGDLYDKGLIDFNGNLIDND